MTDAITLRVDLPVSVETAWALVTEPRHLARWFGPHIELDARPGGAFREIWRQDGRQIVTSGTVEVCMPPSVLAWSWADDDWPATTRVRLTVTPAETGARIALVHDGWTELPTDECDRLRQAHDAGWRMHLDSLARYAADHGAAKS